MWYLVVVSLEPKTGSPGAKTRGLACSSCSLLQTLFVLDTLLYVGLELSPYQVFSQIAFELVACLLLYEVFVCTEKGIVILV